MASSSGPGDTAGGRRRARKGVGSSPGPQPLRLGSHGREGVAIELIEITRGVPPRTSMAALAVDDQAVIVPVSKRAAEKMAGWLREFSRTGDTLPELIGLGGICKEHGITYRTLRKWREHPAFPEPAAEIEGNPIYAAERVRLWVKYDRPKRGRPAKKRSSS